jgi:hypothetical protein
MVAGVFLSNHCTCRTLEVEQNPRSCLFVSFELGKCRDDLETYSLVRGSPRVECSV